MKVTIEFSHEDITRADETNFEAFFVMVQAFAKSLKVGNENILREKVSQVHAEKHSAKKDSTAEKNSVEEKINREEIETEIKKIALEGKEKGASMKIKEILKSFGYEKLSEVPDKKMVELLGKVRGIE